MSQLVAIQTALRLPAPDIEALIQGRTIAALPRMFIRPGQRFALWPTDASTLLLPCDRYYHYGFLTIAQTALNQLDSKEVLLKAWARCELCQILDASEDLGALSQLNIWTTAAIQEILTKWQHIFLAYLRVYQLVRPYEVQLNSDSQQKIGKFIGLPDSLAITEASPVLSHHIFTQRKCQLENRQPPLYPELEELQCALALPSTGIVLLNSPAAQQLNHEIKKCLGWHSEPPIKQLDSKLAWIKTIAELGNRSKQQDQGKSNYQAGTDFENVVRYSLEFLGFTIDYAHRGGAGGLDLFCSKPYPLVGECKAGKSIPNTTAVQLLNLGTLRLKSQEQFNKSAKLIIGPGKPTEQLEDAAKIQGMAIIRPETLENLVKLQSKYQGSVDLFKLRNYLKPGQADDEVEKYIAQIETEIRLRSRIVQAVQELSEPGSEQPTVMVIRTHFNARFAATSTSKLDDQAIHDLLVELSSPLIGYLGRIKGSDWKSDHFYFLRDLPTN